LKAERGWRLEALRHPDRHALALRLEERPRGFRVLPRRWVVERTFAWPSWSRRLARGHERPPEAGEAMIYAAMSRIMLRRCAAA
jgi:transposase